MTGAATAMTPTARSMTVSWWAVVLVVGAAVFVGVVWATLGCQIIRSIRQNRESTAPDAAPQRPSVMHGDAASES